MICPICGSEIADEAVVCVKCGAQIPKAPKSTQAPGYVFGIVSLVLGILSILSNCCISSFSLVFSIAGLIFGILAMSEAKKAGEKNTMALVGVICSGLSILIGIGLVILVVVTGTMGGLMNM